MGFSTLFWADAIEHSIGTETEAPNAEKRKKQIRTEAAGVKP